MKITDVRTVDICVPLSTHGRYEPVTMWYGSRYAALKTIIFIDTDEGLTGIGEAWAPAASKIEGMKSQLMGRDPFDVNAIERRINVTGNVLTTMGHLRTDTEVLNVTGALDMALWDIIGKAANKPIHALIGGRFRERVECRYWMGAKNPQGVAEELTKAVEQGFRSFKIKIGLNPELDLECVKAAREAAGPRIEIGFDVNGGYSVLEAVRTLRKMERYDPSHVEEPVNSANIRALAYVKEHTDIPILCDGPARTTKEQIQELVFQRACDALHLDLTANGGYLETQRCAAIAEAGDLKVSCHSSPGELGIATAAQLHLVTATPNFIWPVDSAYTKTLPPSEDIITQPFVYEGGSLKAPDGPGLGVEIDEESLQRAKHRYETQLDKWQHVVAPDPRVPSRQHYYWYNYSDKYDHSATEWPYDDRR